MGLSKESVIDRCTLLTDGCVYLFCQDKIILFVEIDYWIIRNELNSGIR